MHNNHVSRYQQLLLFVKMNSFFANGSIQYKLIISRYINGKIVKTNRIETNQNNNNNQYSTAKK